MISNCPLMLAMCATAFSYGLMPARADTSCNHNADEKSVYMRSLQTGLMVSALTCGDSAQYNDFIHRFQPVLAKDAKQLQSYYSHKSGGSEELNSFVTHLANDESQRSLQEGQAVYCGDAATLFQNVLALPPEQLEDFAATQPIIPDAPVHACPPPVAAAPATGSGTVSIISNGSAPPADQ